MSSARPDAVDHRSPNVSRVRPDADRLPRRTMPGLAAAAVVALLFVLLRALPGVVEVAYSRGIYPPLARVLSAVSALLPFYVGELLVFAVFLLMWASAIRGWIRARRAGGTRRRAAGRYALRAAGDLAWLWTVFMLLWGFNYARQRPPELFDLGPPVDPQRREELLQLVETRVDELRGLLFEDERGVALVADDLEALDHEIARLQRRALERAGLPPLATGRAKRMLASPLLIRSRVSGMYGPLSGEPGIVMPAAPTTLPFVVAHERAHLAGLAWEEAASFLALLTLWESRDPALQYSAWFALWRGAGRPVEDRAPGVQRDLAAIREFDRAHRGREARAAQRMYDAYLRAHGVEGGRASYGRAGDLALRHLDAHGMPGRTN